MKHILLLLLSFFVPVVWGQQVEQFKLWPDKPEAGEAEIFVYHPAKGGKAAPAVLICPGGGYRGLAMNHEGHDMAKWYASNGFVAVVLKYRMPEGVAIMWKEDVDVSITGNSTNPTRFQHPVAGTYKKERLEAGKKYFSVASGGGTEEEPANCASECIRPNVSVIP